MTRNILRQVVGADVLTTSETNDSIHLKRKTNKNKELTHACFSLLCILEALISGINDGLTDPYDGEPMEEDLKERL